MMKEDAKSRPLVLFLAGQHILGKIMKHSGLHAELRKGDAVDFGYAYDLSNIDPANGKLLLIIFVGHQAPNPSANWLKFALKAKDQKNVFIITEHEGFTGLNHLHVLASELKAEHFITALEYLKKEHGL